VAGRVRRPWRGRHGAAGSPPRWYFGWNIVAAAAFLTLLSSGMRLSFGPFFLPIAQDLGFSRSLLASIVAVGMLATGWRCRWPAT
jgi:hypothetical protein